MLEEWMPGAQIELHNPQGLELLVLHGDVAAGDEVLDRWSWLRLPADEPLRAQVGVQGARVWYKLAPLLHVGVCAFESGGQPVDR